MLLSADFFQLLLLFKIPATANTVNTIDQPT